ncbi:MAG: ROK family transcriptional regulator, partial [Oscillospiraceae bacterium]|nr:ROK family transcriptional regulator [Oscillospiraceae bacterium]
MLMEPAFKDYLWGGERLALVYGKKTDMRPLAESWEVSCHPDGLSAVSNGPFAGQALADVLSKYPGYRGEKADAVAGFPILIKLIDARRDLSLQVHPDDAYARRVEKQPGKNEMWYIIDCEPGAELIIGFKETLSKKELAR